MIKDPEILGWIFRNRKQTAAAMIFTALGLLTANMAERYHPPAIRQEEIQAAEETMETEETAEAIKQAAAETETIQEESYEPSISRLNLAYYFPEEANQANVMESYAGKVYQNLTVKESEWIGSIYDLAEIRPSVMASRLGKGKSSVLGRYNSNDSRQDPDDPSTWMIDNWKKVNITFYNGDGKVLRSYSNVKDVLSMASVYTYITDIMDTDLFERYANQLWDDSHSYTVSMSDVYYCEGCLDKTEEELLAEQEEEELAVTTAFSESASETSAAADAQRLIPGAGEEKQQEESLPSAETELYEEPDDLIASTEAATNEDGEPVGMTIRKSTVDPTQWDHVGPGEEPVATPGNASYEGEAAAEDSLEGALDTVETAAESEAAAAGGNSVQPRSHSNCPGHVDLNISVCVLGLKEKNGLIGIDEIGNTIQTAADSVEADGTAWQGWNGEMLQAAKTIADQDWYQEYGLSISTIHMRDALSSEEVQKYMDGLPDGLSKERRELVQYALSSVGKIPYYWGGKASSPGYEGNSFGTLVPSDMEGRILKGLDCSGWINWVYWSVTGKPLEGQSTSGLALCGRAIQREELQPGDIVLKTGTGAHVVMFLDWVENGQMLVIHESSTAVNNVTLKVMEADWPYYRNLLD